MISVLWHYNSGFWDCALPRFILNHAERCRHLEGLQWGKEFLSRTGVIVIPARHSCSDYESINKAASQFFKVVFILIGDEEGVFDSGKLDHPRMVRWWFMPPFKRKQKIDRLAPNGWPTDAPEMIAAARKSTHGVRDLNFSFLGQVTHERRITMIEGLRNYVEEAHRRSSVKFHLLATEGFTQGEPRERYYEIMARSKIVLCPSGPCTPDSFRFAEALEAGCVPIVDNLTPNPEYPAGYWEYVFGSDVSQFPFPIINFWEDIERVIERTLPRFDELALDCKFWWTQQKELMTATMKEDLCGI